MDAAASAPASRAAHAEDGDDVDRDGEEASHLLRDIVEQFQCAPSELNLDCVDLDLRNGQAVRTILTLLLAAKPYREDEHILPNFITYVVHDLVRLDDFDMKLQLVTTFQDFVSRLYSKQTSRLLMELCEQFLQPEDSMIREEAYKLVTLLLVHLDAEEVDELLVIVQRIFENEWNQCTGIDLMAICFHKVPENVKEDYRKQFVALMNDDATLAKAAMARNYAKVVQHYRKEWVEGEAIDILQHLVDDIQVTARMHSVEIAITIASAIEEDLVDKHLATIFEKLSQDNAWKVRLEVAARIVDIQRAVRPKMSRILIITLLQTLCTDRESMVRKCLAMNIIDVVVLFKETADIDLGDIFEVINELNKDANDEVRNNLMSVMMDCATHLTKSECRTHLLPLMKNTLMCQSIAGVQKVQEQCVYNINKLIAVLGYEVMQVEIERFIFDVLSAESQWRTRRRLVMTLNILALNATEEYFTKVILAFYKKMLNDSCHAVRRIVPMLLPVLVGRFGFEWGREHILSYVFSFHDHPTSFQRLLVLYAIEELVQPSLARIPTSKFARKSPLTTAMSKDYLYKVYSLNEMLKYKLDQLEIHVDADLELNPIASSDLDFYGEDMNDEFAEFEVPAEDIHDQLTFVIKHIIPILANYLNDKVINVVNRAINTYQIIMRLQQDLAERFQADDFKAVPASFNKEHRQTIESHILQELTAADGHMEEKFEHAVRGKEFEANVRFEDASENGFDGLSNESFALSAEEAFKDFEELQDTPDYEEVDSNENVREDDVDNANTTKDETTHDSNDNAVDKHLLDDVDMKLFDEKKTVLEFYSDSTSDAINI